MKVNAWNWSSLLSTNIFETSFMQTNLKKKNPQLFADEKIISEIKKMDK